MMCVCSEAWLPVLLMVGNATGGGGGAGPSGKRTGSRAAYDNVKGTRQPLTRCRRPSVLQFGVRTVLLVLHSLFSNKTKSSFA